MKEWQQAVAAAVKEEVLAVVDLNRPRQTIKQRSKRGGRRAVFFVVLDVLLLGGEVLAFFVAGGEGGGGGARWEWSARTHGTQEIQRRSREEGDFFSKLQIRRGQTGTVYLRGLLHRDSTIVVCIY